MKNKLISHVNNLNEGILAFTFVGILVLSLVVAQSIQIDIYKSDKVLGIDNTKQEFFNSTDSSSLYKIFFKKLPYQYTFDIELNPKGTKSFIIPLGSLNSYVQGGASYRASLTIPEIYKDDFDIKLIVGNDSYPLFLDNKGYVNDLKITNGVYTNISLELNTNKEIYYKESIQFTLYK